MRTLCLYDSNSTHTNAVYDHINGFLKYRSGEIYFCDCNSFLRFLPTTYFHNIVIHYSVRVAHKKIPKKFIQILKLYAGLKVLFLQDEYENTNTSISFILDAGIDVVYTCVPKKFIKTVYGNNKLKDIIFFNTLTGYVVETELGCEIKTIAQRPTEIGFRGTVLPYWYGDLGQEKIKIAQGVLQQCAELKFITDIEFDVSKRIYGKDWPKFLGNCRVVLGAESGCNLFDYDGAIKQSWLNYLQDFPDASYAESRKAVLGSLEEKPIMNQISPRVFEAISAKTALMMFAGDYSGVLVRDCHYIALEKDFSNLKECLMKVRDTEFLQTMVDRTFNDVILNPKYHEKTFFEDFYKVLDNNAKKITTAQKKGLCWLLLGFTLTPLRPVDGSLLLYLKSVWRFLPEFLKKRLRPFAHVILFWLTWGMNKTS